MIYLKSLLNVIDNSGAQVVECIKVLRHKPKSCAQIGDRITCVVKQARPLQQELTGQSSTNRVKREIYAKPWLSEPGLHSRERTGVLLDLTIMLVC